MRTIDLNVLNITVTESLTKSLSKDTTIDCTEKSLEIMDI